MADVAARDAATSARRRRERLLRAFHRHVVLSVKMALATALHHSAQRVEVPREVEEHEAYVGPRAQKTPPPKTRPASLVELQGAQERVKRHTVEQFGELAPTVQILDAPVPQSGDQLLETLKNDIVELVIEVPKIILLDYTPLRAVAAVGGTVGGCVSSGVDRADTRQRRGGPRLVPHRCVWGPPRGLLVAVGSPPGITTSPGR